MKLVVDLNRAARQDHRLCDSACGIFELQVHQRYVDNFDNIAIDERNTDAFKIYVK